MYSIRPDEIASVLSLQFVAVCLVGIVPVTNLASTVETHMHDHNQVTLHRTIIASKFSTGCPRCQRLSSAGRCSKIQRSREPNPVSLHRTLRPPSIQVHPADVEAEDEFLIRTAGSIPI